MVAAWDRRCQFDFPARRIRGIRVYCIRTRVLDVTLAQPVFRVPARTRMTLIGCTVIISARHRSGIANNVHRLINQGGGESEE